MTSDAKIGLLLGLVFIFVIAFVINGLPGLHHKDDGNKLTTNMVGLQNSSPGIGANERRVALEQQTPPAGYAPPGAAASPSTDPRFSMPLQQNAPADATASNAAVAPEQTTISQTPVTVFNPIDNTNTSIAAPAAPATSASPAITRSAQTAPAAEKQPLKKQEPAKAAEQKVYVVQPGDSLSSIAKKVYGEQAGNKLANINAIFEANRKTLPSVDELQVGQKLTIPPLAGTAAPAPTPSSTLPSQTFAKVDNVGQRHLPAVADKPAVAVKTVKPESSAKPGNIYVVKEGDSLWQIATAQLGDGNRYKEIVKLNSSLMASEDDLQIGMQLKMPAK